MRLCNGSKGVVMCDSFNSMDHLASVRGQGACRTSSRLRRLWLAVILCLCSLTIGRGASLTLTWDAVVGTNITYRVYQSVGDGAYNLTTNVLIGTQATVNYDSTLTNRWRVTAFSTAYQIQESEPSNVLTRNPPPPPLIGLTFEAESGVIAAPFYINGTVVQQDTLTGASDGGRASYTFNVATAGVFTVSAIINAQDGGSDSIFVNIDAEPTEVNLWSIPLTSGFEKRTVRFQSDTNDHSFTLTATSHVLIIRGREAGCQIDKIIIAPVSTPTPPTPIPGSPPTPSGLRSVSISPTRLDISWTLPAPYNTRIERAEGNSPFTEVASIAPGVYHYTSAIRKNRDYWFRARSFDPAYGFSNFSNQLFFSSR